MQQVALTFEDVAVCFSEEEWRGLRETQKELYRAVMTDNYRHLTSLGLSASKPEIVMKIERGEDPFLHREPSALQCDSPERSSLKERRTKKLTWNLRRNPVHDSRGAETHPLPGEGRTLRSRKRPQQLQKEGASSGWAGDVASAGNAASCAPGGKKCAVQEPPGEGPRAGTEDQEPGPPGDGTRGEPRVIKEEEPAQRPAMVEGPGKPFTCVLCGESWNHLADLLSHQMERCQVRPHRCPVCPKSFVKKQHLSAHRKTHTEARPYTCHQCGKSFRQNSTLTTHLWSHAGHKPFLCTVCTKRFSRKTDLIAHVRRHTGERPYQCPYCWDTFIRKKSLQRHLQKHAGGTLPPAGDTLPPAWDFAVPAGALSDSMAERNVKCEPGEGHQSPDASPARELSPRWTDGDQRRGISQPPPGRHTGQSLDPGMEPVMEPEETVIAPEPVETKHQSTQTEPQRKKALTAQQRMLRELRRFRRAAARSQRDQDAVRLAVDQLSEGMRELKELVGTLCATKALADRSPAEPGAPLMSPSCPVWINQEPTSGRPPQDRLCVAFGRASPESGRLSGPGHPVETFSERANDRSSWMYRTSSRDDAVLRRTTAMASINKEQDLESPGGALSGAADFSRYQVGERLPSIAMLPLSAEKERALLAKSGGKPGRFAALVFRALVPYDVYKGWVNRVNLDGLRGRKGIPLNVKRRMMGVVERYFTLRKSEHREICNRLNEQLRTRRGGSKTPKFFY